jgi:hypothetical protein
MVTQFLNMVINLGSFIIVSKLLTSPVNVWLSRNILFVENRYVAASRKTLLNGVGSAVNAYR